MIVSIWHVDAGGAVSLAVPSVPYSSLQWTRRSSKVGEFAVELACPMPVEWPGRYLLTVDGEREVGVVEKCDAAEDGSGDSASLSGRFAESLFDRWRAPAAGASVSGADARQAITAAMAAWHMDDVPEIAMGEGTAAKTGSSVSIALESKDSAMDGIYSAAEAAGLVPLLALDWERGRLVAEIHEGLDRTRGQSERPVTVFSLAMSTINESSYSGDYSVAFSEVLAHGEKGSGDDVVSLDATVAVPGFDPGTMWKGRAVEDVSSLLPDEPSASDVEDAAALRAYDYRPSVTIDTTVTGEGYGETWDLGDTCEAEVACIGLVAEERVEEVRLTEEADGVTVEASLGTKQISRIARAMMGRR